MQTNEMCEYYEYVPEKKLPWCIKRGHRASLKCHSRNPCPDYKPFTIHPSWKGELDNELS